MVRLDDQITIKQVLTKKDKRGWLAELVRPDDVGNETFGQILLTVSNPGETKGNHYHKRKTEWYCVIKGKAILTIYNNATGDKRKHTLSDKRLCLIRIPPDHSHSIINVGEEEMYLLVYISEAFNPSDPDTYKALL